jgi:predicted anti-sigma-YlaC factor YlaD
MNCSTFQEILSDYLDGALDARGRAECASHRLICRECRELFNDVRETVQTLGGLSTLTAEPEGLEARILAATTTGEMLSCGSFDQLLERYFDGVMLAPDHQIFQAHFVQCSKCRRLLAGIEEAIALCREVKELEVEMPDSLPERIVSVTTGKSAARSAGRLTGWLGRFANPQWAAAALIFAASLFLISLRFGSLTSFAVHANGQAEKVLSELNQTGLQARHQFGRVSTQLGQAWASEPPAKPSAPPAPRVSPTPKS